ncbi:alcohol oxidase [Teratosphaeria nubilosa]|uniref:Alcohol oxidase n=1 Tax=Teratosphaeria nubilosa TaxID=161662 RepID=A0A6G1KW34_9PEZI|nr:alcohol oxidase [Teratosphaeria nubilosa]
MAEYDYIICGGGTAGCVVAARLADELNARVLVIEAGAHNKDLENVHMVGGWSKNFDGPEDWNLETVPQKHANNRKVKLSRGRFLGGSSGVNGTLCIRGSHQDYDDWSLQGWSGDEFFAAMRKAETFRNKPWFTPAPNAHGTDGPLNIEPHDLAPISELVMESYQSMGLPYDADMFTTGETAHGCGHALRTHYKGLRTTAADFVTNEQHRDNIDLLVNTVVDKVNFDHSSGIPRAVSVDVVGPDGTRETMKAKREIIVTGGSYCTPPILMRSGIGPREELEKHGIDVLVESPGVGQNLMDHLIVFTFYEVAKEGLTNDYKVYHGDALASTYAQWKNEKSGFLSTFPFGSFAFARLDERLKDDPIYQKGLESAPEGRDPMHLTPKQPNLEWFTTECYGGPKQYTDFPIDNKHAFAMITELFSPRSRGTVSLQSKNPHDNPIIDPNYLSHELDLLYLCEGVRMGNEIVMQGSGTKNIIKGSWPSELMHHQNTSRQDWVEHVKEEATTCYHPAGTAKTGKDGDKFAVLDERLRVRGVQGLRVADCSVMPTLHQGHTQMPAYGIGERCADFIEHERGLADVQAKGASLEKVDSVVS